MPVLPCLHILLVAACVSTAATTSALGRGPIEADDVGCEDTNAYSVHMLQRSTTAAHRVVDRMNAVGLPVTQPAQAPERDSLESMVRRMSPTTALGLGLLGALEAPGDVAPWRGAPDAQLQGARLSAISAAARMRSTSEENARLRRTELRLLEENTRLRSMLQGREVPAPGGRAALIAGGVGVVVLVLGVLLCSRHHHRRKKKAQDEDEAPDRGKSRCGCLSWTGVRNFGVFAVVAVTGFVALWRAGFIQPFVQQMIVYLYIACVIASILFVIMLEAWGDIRQMQERIMGIILKVQHLFTEGGVEELEEDIALCCGSAAGEKSSASGASPTADPGCC